MPRWRGTTTQRGLGAEHKATRARLLAAFRDGDPCPYAATRRCKYPDGRMWHWQPLDSDHIRPRILGGAGGPEQLAHRRCNRSAGATLGNQLRSTRTAGNSPHRTCSACGRQFQTRSPAQRTCGARCQEAIATKRSSTITAPTSRAW